jgi:hypothetical protein
MLELIGAVVVVTIVIGWMVRPSSEELRTQHFREFEIQRRTQETMEAMQEWERRRERRLDFRMAWSPVFERPDVQQKLAPRWQAQGKSPCLAHGRYECCHCLPCEVHNEFRCETCWQRVQEYWRTEGMPQPDFAAEWP